MCDAMSCGRGSCRWGKCTCDFGVSHELDGRWVGSWFPAKRFQPKQAEVVTDVTGQQRRTFFWLRCIDELTDVVWYSQLSRHLPFFSMEIPLRI